MPLTLDPAGTAAALPTEEEKPFDILEDQREVVTKLQSSPEIDELTSLIDVTDMSSIVTFGHEAAEEISKVSDTVLRSMSLSELDDTGVMMQALAKIMDRFNIDEVRENNSFFGRLFGGAHKQIDRILDKYNTMGDEVDKIYVQLRKYEEEIKRSNQGLDALFQANLGYFHELEKYIVAGEQGCKEISEYLEQQKAEYKATGNIELTLEIQSLEQALNMLEQRVADLRTAEAVALQSIPMLRMIEFNNMTLVRKINSAFIVTLPVFKQALAQAILLKRQKIQNDALSALDKRTNDMLIRNSRNAAEQSKLAARMANGSAVKSETLETAWRTIVTGIDETKQITQKARAQREGDQAKLEAIRKAYLERSSAGR